MKRVVNKALVAVLIAGAIGFTACSSVSEEQMAQLDALRSEVKALEKEVGELKNQKSTLEREIAEANSKLDQCNKEKSETKKNLEKIGL